MAALATVGALAGAAGAAQVRVYPTPGTRVASPHTQFSFRGVAPGAVGTITVTGSQSGPHVGQLEAHSDGRGASFLPSAPFVPGEVVTVQTSLDIEHGRGGDFSVRIATQGPPIRPTPKQPPTLLRGAGLQRFHSRHDLVPPLLSASAPHGRTAPGDLLLGAFSAPFKLGPGQRGPMIVDADGNLVWFQPLGGYDLALDVRVQRYRGQPVLTWWQGFVNAGVGVGVGQILDTSYRRIATVSAGNGYGADPHELLLTPRGTALVVVENPVVWDLSKLHGGKHTVVLDSVVQEIDVATGLVLFEWHSIDHVAVRDSYATPAKVDGHVDDYFHINSVAETPDGNLLVCARNTWAIYKVARADGRVLWRLGGKRTSFRMGRGTRFAWQHDARVLPDGTITLFDDAAAPPIRSFSRGLGIGVNTHKRTAWLAREYRPSPRILAGSQGNVQALANGNVLVGWGSEPYVSEYSRHGALVRQYRFPTGDESYRAYRFPWDAQPAEAPAVAASTAAQGATKVFMSWNGATGVASWEVLAGASAGTLAPVASVRRTGFETTATLTHGAIFVAVQAKDAAGRVLGTSATIAPKRQ